MLGQSWAGARKSLMEEDRVLMHESQRNKLGEAAGLALNLPQHMKLIDPVLGSFDVAIHQRGGAANATSVRGADDFLPLRGRKLVARKDVADFVVENLCGGAGERVEAVVTQHVQIVSQRHAGEFNAIDDFHRREGVDVHSGHRRLHRPQNIPVIERRQAMRQTALDADFGGTKIPCLDGLFRDLLRFKEVSIGLPRAAAEGAELASDETNVGEIDVAVHDVGDNVAGKLAAQEIGGDEQANQVVAFSVGKEQ